MAEQQLSVGQKDTLAKVTDVWQKPGEIGAPDSTLKALVRRGLVENRYHGPRGNEYRRVAKGEADVLS